MLAALREAVAERTIRRVRRLRIALVLATTLVVQFAYAAPARATAALAALSCCSAHCRETKAESAAKRCCGVRLGAAEIAVAPVAKKSSIAPAVAVLGAISTTPLQHLRAELVFTTVSPRARNGPIFLLTRSLRL
jgi:hypothetical protein